MVRAGAILPLLPPDVDTLANYGRAPGLVHLGDRRGRLRLLAFPRGHSSARAGTGQRLHSFASAGRWELRVTGKRRTRYALQASLATLKKPFVPCSVRLGRHPLAPRAWSYDPATRVLGVRFAARSNRLVARACS
jgi:hypothetical protein